MNIDLLPTGIQSEASKKHRVYTWSRHSTQPLQPFDPLQRGCVGSERKKTNIRFHTIPRESCMVLLELPVPNFLFVFRKVTVMVYPQAWTICVVHTCFISYVPSGSPCGCEETYGGDDIVVNNVSRLLYCKSHKGNHQFGILIPNLTLC